MQFKILNEAEILSLHHATLRILQETGILLTEPRSREILSGNGCTILEKRVLFPPHLVEKCIQQAGKQISLTGRNGGTRTLGDGSLYFHNLGGAREVYDQATRTRRAATTQDVIDSTRLLDALENCHTVTPFFTPRDVPGGIMSLAMYRHALPHTTKPLQGPGVQFASEARYAVRMAEVLGKAAEVTNLSLSPVSPLSLPEHEAEAILEIAGLGIPFSPLPCPTAGTTAPFTIAGALAQQNAEILSAVVLAQLVHPGLPITYCGRLGMMEPRTGVLIWGGVELGIASAGTVQLGHHYGFAVNVYGFSTNSHTLDQQNGFERALNAVIPALAGAEELSGIGEMEAGVMGSYAQMVADSEFAGSILRARRGFAVNDETLGVDVIARVMETTRNYLGQKHTLKFIKAGEVALTRLADRNTWEAWERLGTSDLAGRAQADAERILREHTVPPLEARQEKELDSLLEAAAQEITL